MTQNRSISIRIATAIACAVACHWAMAAPAPDAQTQAKGGKGGKSQSWYLKTQVYAEQDGQFAYDDRSGVIGRISGAESGKDPHDIPAFEPVNGSRAAIVFVQDESAYGDAAGQYLSDYRSPGNNKQVWTFTVTSAMPNADVTLYWEGLYTITEMANGRYGQFLDNSNKVLRNLQLVDLELGEVVTMAVDRKGNPQSYTFNMNGAGQRQFRWVQGGVSTDDLAATTAGRLDDALLRVDAISREGRSDGPPLLPAARPGVTTEPVERHETEK